MVWLSSSPPTTSMKLIVSLILLSLGSLAIAACPYNNCHHPQWPSVQTGTCVSDTCNCATGFGGLGCSQVTGCPTSCNNGNCVGGKCVCTAGFAGPLCNIATCTSNCNDNGLCNAGTCECYPGYSGPACATATIPAVSNVKFSSDWHALEATFNVDTNKGGLTTTACTTILDATTRGLLGTGPVCSWESADKLVVHLPHDATVIVGSAFTFVSGVIKNMNPLDTAGMTTGLTSTVQVSGTALTPAVKYISPEMVGPCDDLVIDATQSTGLAARTGTFTFSKISGTNVTIPSGSSNGRLFISASDLTNSVVNPWLTSVIKFSVSVQNAFGTTSAAETVTIIRKPWDIASVTILTPKSVNVPFVAGKTQKFQAQVSTCGLGVSPTLTYKWTIYGNTLGASLLHPTTGSALTVNSGVFTPGKTYTVQVSVGATGLAVNTNGTAAVLAIGVYTPLNSILLPTKIDKAATVNGFGLVAQASSSFGDWGQIITGRAFVWECEFSSSGTWTAGCKDMTMPAGTNLAAPTDAGSTTPFTIGANVLAPGRYRFRFTTSATGRTSVASKWSYVTVSQSMTAYPAISGVEFMSSLHNGILYLQDSATQNVDIKTTCATCTALTVAGAAATSGTAASVVAAGTKLGQDLTITIVATAGSAVTNAEVTLPIAPAPMAGTVSVMPAGPYTPLSVLTLIVKGAYQPGFGGMIETITLGTSRIISGNVFTDVRLPQGSNALVYTFKSNLKGLTTYTAPAITVGAPAGNTDQQITAVTNQLDTDLENAKTSGDPEQQSAAAKTALDIIGNYDTTTKTAAAQAKFDATIQLVVDAFKDASANLVKSPDVDVASNIIAGTNSVTSLTSVKASQITDAVDTLNNTFSAIGSIVSITNPVKQIVIDSSIEILSVVRTKGTPSQSLGAKASAFIDNLGKTLSKQLPIGGSVVSTKPNVAIKVTKFDTTADPTGNTVMNKPTSGGVTGSYTFNSVPSSVASAVTSQTNFNMYGTKPTGIDIAHVGDAFVSLTFLTSTGTAVNDVSDPTVGGKTGSKVSMKLKTTNRSGYMSTLFKFTQTTVTSVAGGVYDVVTGLTNYESTKFSDFGIYPVLKVLPGLPPATIAIIVVVLIVVILILGGFGYKYGPSLSFSKLSIKSGDNTSAGKGRAMLFYDPSAEPGEQWVQIASGGGAAEKEKEKEKEKDDKKKDEESEEVVAEVEEEGASLE